MGLVRGLEEHNNKHAKLNKVGIAPTAFLPADCALRTKGTEKSLAKLSSPSRLITLISTSH